MTVPWKNYSAKFIQYTTWCYVCAAEVLCSTLIGLFQVCGHSGCGLFDVWKVFITGPEASFVDFHTVTRLTQLTTKANELVSNVIMVSGSLPGASGTTVSVEDCVRKPQCWLIGALTKTHLSCSLIHLAHLNRNYGTEEVFNHHTPVLCMRKCLKIIFKSISKP